MGEGKYDNGRTRKAGKGSKGRGKVSAGKGGMEMQGKEVNGGGKEVWKREH